MADVIKVSASRMVQDRERISACMDEIAAGIGEFRDAMLALSACWEGPAWESFRSELGTTIEEMNDICSFFSEYVYQNAEAEKEYQRCETDNRSRIWQIWI